MAGFPAALAPTGLAITSLLGRDPKTPLLLPIRSADPTSPISLHLASTSSVESPVRSATSSTVVAFPPLNSGVVTLDGRIEIGGKTRADRAEAGGLALRDLPREPLVRGLFLLRRLGARDGPHGDDLSIGLPLVGCARGAVRVSGHPD